MTENNNLQSVLCNFRLWTNNSNPVWLASTINIFRNIEKFKFPIKLDLDRRKQIVSLLSKELLTLNLFQHPTFFKGEEISGLDKEYLVEHFLSSQSFHSAGAGEAFILDEAGEYVITLNMRNHIHFEYIDIKGELESSWNKLVKIETALGKIISYSYSPKFGFLTADITQCGTALLVTAFLQLSGLIHTQQIDSLLEHLVDESFAVTGIQGSPTEIIGDVLEIQNNYTIGLSEENIISSLRGIITKLLVEEQAARNKIKNENQAVIKDKISRAYGILTHSYQIEAVEALNAISLLKLGVDIGWVTGITIVQLNQLFFYCRRAHLASQYIEKIAQEQIAHKRAEFIHKSINTAKLTI